jgi:hypothetical protein
VASNRHPTFSFVRRTTVAAVVTLWAAFAMPSATAAAQADAKGYRLAGTLAVGPDYIAFLEVPEGGQVLVRTGSVVNGTRVVSVDSREIKLALPGGVVVLALDGSVHEAALPTPTAIITKQDDERSSVYTREVSPDTLSRELKSASGAQPAKTAQANEMVAAQRVAAVLDLPSGSAVQRVQGQPVTSADAAIKRLQSVFAGDAGVVILDIKTPTGAGRVYLMRNRN